MVPESPGTPRYTVQYYRVQYSTIQYNTVQYNTVQYSTVQYNTVHYSTVQYNTMGSIIWNDYSGFPAPEDSPGVRSLDLDMDVLECQDLT